MSDLSKRIVSLSPEQRGVLASKLMTLQVPAQPTHRISRSRRPADLPLSYAQQRLWFLDQLRPGDATYNLPVAVRLKGRLNVPALAEALSEIIRRHEIFRTTFPAVDGKPQQMISPAQCQQLLVVDLSYLAENEGERQARRLAVSEAGRAFDLAQGPLLRPMLLKIGATDHVLLLTMHHIISDAWSLALMVREIQALYAAVHDGKPAVLPEMKIQYADYAVWQRQPFYQELCARQLDYWKKQLADLPPLLDLPTDRPRSPVQSFRGSAVSFELSESLGRRIFQLRRREGATLFMVLMAGFATLLHRYTGQDDVTVGTDIANRNWSDTEALIGFFVNQLAVRVDVSGDPSFSQVLRRVKDRALDAFANQDLPFEQLVAALQPERSLSHVPLFQVKLVVQNAPAETIRLPELAIERFAVHNATIGFELILTVLESPGKLRGALEYNTDLFDRATVERLVGHYQGILEAATSDPSRPISRLSIMAAAEKRVLRELNRTSAALPEPLPCLHQLFEQHAAAAPDRTAVVAGAQSLSYGALNDRANQLARYLHTVGIGPDVIVGLCLERSVEMVVAMLAVLKAGGAYLPLDPKYPAQRLEHMLKDSAAPVLLTQQNLLDQLPSLWSQVICLDAQADEIERHSTVNLQIEVSPRNLAYVIYTSGSTGKPKGVAVEHYGIANLSRWQARQFGLTSASRISQFASYSFDAAVGETCMALLNGATLIMIEREDLGADSVMQAINRHRITVMVLVPSMLKTLDVDAIEHPEELTVVAVGETCPPELALRWSRRCHFKNAYGPTEYTVYSHLWSVEPGDVALRAGTVPIGMPIANTKTYILDAQLNPVPVGVTGEIYISGRGIARGYLHNPGATAAKLLPNPFLLDEYITEHDLLETEATAAEIREFELRMRAFPQPRAQPELRDWPKHISPAMIFKLIGSMSSDLIKKTHAFITQHAEASPAYCAFIRYLLEGVNGSYASGGLNPEVLRRLLPFEKFAGVRGIDFGFGNGEVLKTLNQMGARVTGLDFNPVFVQKARDAGLAAEMIKIDLEPGEFAASCGIEPGTQDFAISTLLLDRLANPRGMLENFFMVLKQGGCFALQTLLPIVGVDDGDVTDPLTYTPVSARIAPGRSAEQDKLALVRLLLELGADRIEIHKLPYVVMSRDGLQEYVIWSFTGIKNSEASRLESVERYDCMYKTGDRGRFLRGGEIEFRGRADTQVKVRGYRIELGEIEAAVSAHSKVRDCAVLSLDSPHGGQRLTAYVVTSGAEPPREDELANFLRQRLPSFMVPSAFVFLDRLPLHPNGKIAHDKLPAVSEAVPGRAQIAPRNRFEQAVAEAWREVLNLETISIHDNIFDLGGDSILILQILGKLNQVGIHLRTSHFFEYQTIARLAEAQLDTEANSAEQGLISGEVRLTPVQRWFFEQELSEPHHYNQSILLQARGSLEARLLDEAFRHLVAHHDALRLCFRRRESGWEQSNAAAISDVIFSCRQIIAIDEQKIRQELARATAELQGGLNLERGPLIKACLFSFDGHMPDRLLVVIHHLAVDVVSWRILLEDLHAVYGQLLRQEPVALPAKTISWQRWAERLEAFASSSQLDADSAYWLALSQQQAKPPPVDCRDGENSEGSADSIGSTLSVEQTAKLLEQAPRVWRSSVHEVLLAAVARALSSWVGGPVLFDVEAHGREDLFEGVDASRTVGWFTAVYPALLDCSQVRTPLESIAIAKQVLRAVPRRGLSYGLLRYSSAATSVGEALRAAQPAAISFNYLGHFDGTMKQSALFERRLEAEAPERSLLQQRRYLLEVSAFIAAKQLHFNIRFSRNLHRRATIEALVERAAEFVRTSIADSGAQQAVTLVPADFPLAKLDSRTLTEILESAGPVENIYPLTPLQQGLLYHSLAAPDSGVYVNQMSFELKGELSIAAFCDAWKEVTRRHDIFRTGYVWGRLAEPLAVVREQVALPFVTEDWRAVAQSELEGNLARYLEEDRLRGFDLGKAPLMRLRLLRIGAASYRFFWSFHHLLLDGWSVYRVLREMFLIYEEACGGTRASLDPVRPYTSYIEWLGQQSIEKAETFWRKVLRGCASASYIPANSHEAATAGQKGFADHQSQFSAVLTGRLQSLARQHRLTMNTIVQGAWALLQSRYTDSDDVIFGTVVSGRPASLTGIEQTVGLFINTLPVRARILQDATLIEWLHRLQIQQAEMIQYEYSPLLQVQRWSEVSRAQPLFNAILVFENYPISGSLAACCSRLQIEGVSSVEQTNYPLTVMVAPSESLEVRTVFDPSQFDLPAVQRMMGHFEALLEAIVEHPQLSVGMLPMLSPRERLTLLREWNSTAAALPPAQTLPQLFSLQASRSAERLAVSCGEQRCTYRQLEESSNRLARYLCRQGVSRGSLVGISLSRSVLMVEAVLAVMKAGAAYVPLDPSYPQARLRLMVEDSGMEVLLGDAQTSWAEGLGKLKRVVNVPAEQDAIASERASPPQVQICGEDAAYVIYTSGSTGRPKGVQVPHAAVINFLHSMRAEPGIDENDVLLAVTSLSFDIAALELYLPLSIGATTVIVSREVAADGFRLAQASRQSGATMMQATPSTWRMLASSGWQGNKPLKMLCGGEALAPDLAEQMLKWRGQVYNLYGPTETTIWSTLSRVTLAKPPALGHPIANTQCYVLDAMLGLAPTGARGELHIAGAGVACGYLHQPALTAERFIANPYGEQPGARMYRTGDLVRYSADGSLEFLGRLDHQAKIRGHRIELGDIENSLRSHPMIAEAVVRISEETPAQQQLIAYITTDPYYDQAPGADRADRETEQLGQWQMVWDKTYSAVEDQDSDFNIAGWKSSYTGQPIAAEQMRLWVAHTVARISALRPSKLLEVGCGTGLLLLPLAAACQQYVGLDFSSASLDHIRRQLRGSAQLQDRVRLLQRQAHELEDLEDGVFDTAVLNSVVQYFPSLDYLMRVLDALLPKMAKGGRIFLGDLRSLPLLEAFHASVELERAAVGEAVEIFRQSVAQRVQREAELVIDARLFGSLRARWPRLGRVEVIPKRGGYDNELSRFRYDVVLYLDARAEREGNWRTWVPGMTPEVVARELSASGAEEICLRSVANSRTEQASAIVGSSRTASAMQSVGAIRAQVQSTEMKGVDPERWWTMGQAEGLHVEESWASGSTDGSYDVVVRRSGSDLTPLQWADVQEELGRPSAFANVPLRARAVAQALSTLREYLREKLPDYMCPAEFALLERMPLTPNGKIDRKALDLARRARSNEPEPVAPRSETERTLLDILGKVLRKEHLGVNDNFFDVGGHSLLATQAVSKIRDCFQLELSLRAFFESPSAARLAQRIEAIRSEATKSQLPTIAGIRGEGDLPLSFAQQRLWFLEYLEPGSAAYNMPAAVRLEGRLDIEAMQRALTEIVRRHEVLRTRFPEVNGQPVQLICAAAAVPLSVEDLTIITADEREARASKILNEEAHRPFDLADGSPLKVRVLRLAPETHLVLVTMHHIVSDGESMSLLMHEVHELYAAFSRGQPSPLAELAIQYADYALWQRQPSHAERLERELTYWRERLAGMPPMLDLPTDKPRPVVPRSQGARVVRKFPQEMAEALHTLCRQKEVTLFMALLAAFQALLARYCGQQDIAIGTPVAGRNRSELEGLIGVFVNTLVIRTELSPNLTFSALLQRVRTIVLEALEHQEVPFEQLVEALQPQRHLSVIPLFQVMFTVQSAQPRRFHLPGLQLAPIELERRTSIFDVSLDIAEHDNGLVAVLEYNTDLFFRETAERLLAHLEVLLRTAVAAPDTRLSELPILSDAERARVLLEWSGGGMEDAGQELVHRVIQQRACEAPSDVALRCQGNTISYDELEKRTNQLARFLGDHGIGAESVVGILADKSVEAVVAMLATLKAGAAFLPLDPGYPPERLHFMIADADVGILLTFTELAKKLPLQAARIVCFDREWEQISRRDTAALPTLVDPDSLAYVIYTSGSTGTPKGVMIAHRQFASFVQVAVTQLKLRRTHRLLQFASLSFDVAIEEIFPALAAGATLVVPRAPPFPSELTEIIEREGVTALELPTAYWYEWIAELQRQQRRVPESLSLLIIGGESLPLEKMVEWHEVATSKVTLTHAYGLTETAVTSSTYDLRGPALPQTAGLTLPIGRPWPNQRMYLLDAHLRPLPAGIPGEIYVGGDVLARGYLGLPSKTAEKYVANPFSSRAGTRLYRTGDLARYLPDGNIEFLGRSDAQVKIRGYRIEPGEIEAALGRHAAVSEAVVVVQTTARGDHRLVAYFISEGVEPSDTELRAFLKQRLSEYMVPALFARLDRFPLTLSGKVDRKQLAALNHERDTATHEYVEPQTALETKLAAIWAQVLEVERVGVNDNFFDLGGHSLLAVQVTSRMREAFGIEVPLRAIFERPSIVDFAPALFRDADASSAVPGILRSKATEVEELLSRIDQFSDAEVDSLLGELLPDGSET